ncbi:hypothetical protein [Massilia rhizosphaerae]|uniref:hypothetical protein n=1 Tax=Massilia rhizosphaerae TaxID=2784389 RepID=UPI0018DD9F7A|nr:hypothetical protein [Massilia rhizosphaerae]
MSQGRSAPDQHTILADAWGQVVGGMEWLRSVLFGEFADHRPLSAVVADMLVSFIPGVVIVTSARDAVAVILRLAIHPEKREDLMEWVLLCACLIVIALPIAMAAGSAVALGVGAVVGGVAGSELGAALRAVMLMLIKEASQLVELVRFLQKFMKGDVLKFLRGVKFAKYERALIQAICKIIGKLLEIVRALRVHLESLRYFDTVKIAIAKLTDWEKRFYDVQRDALRQVPRAVAELDARLAKVLAQTAPKESHMVAAGVQADKTVAKLPARQRVIDTPGKVLPEAEGHVVQAGGPTKTTIKAARKAKPESPPNSPSKEKPEAVALTADGPNMKKQAVIDVAIVADRERITQFSNEGKIKEAQDILQPYVDAAKRATTIAEKRSAMNSIIDRLDVTSVKEKMFWSGNKGLAKKIAQERGKIILEQTPGGKVIDDWDDLNRTFSWDPGDMEPHGWDLWGAVSAEYARHASGEIDIIQSAEKFPRGGETWRGSEWTTIVRERKVELMNIFAMDEGGNVIKTMRMAPSSEVAKELFKRK